MKITEAKALKSNDLITIKLDNEDEKYVLINSIEFNGNDFNIEDAYGNEFFCQAKNIKLRESTSELLGEQLTMLLSSSEKMLILKLAGNALKLNYIREELVYCLNLEDDELNSLKAKLDSLLTYGFI